jgi:chemotaxis protein methyltransferase CheR
MNELEYGAFRKQVMSLTGIDLFQYKSNQITRRLANHLHRIGVKDLTAYGRILASDSDQLEKFKDFLTINVSEFFRNPERFLDLEKKVLPVLAARNPGILRIWSAGCSTGPEPYTLAMIFDSALAGRQYQILATDLDIVALSKAKTGIYTELDIKNVPSYLASKYLLRPSDKSVHVVESIKKRINYKQHNLLSDPFERGFDLIVCRNVVIYFNDEAKERLYTRFAESLRPGGMLFVGGTEIIRNSRNLGLEPFIPFVYQKITSQA